MHQMVRAFYYITLFMVKKLFQNALNSLFSPQQLMQLWHLILKANLGLAACSAKSAMRLRMALFTITPNNY
jgi:hypothetical protein